MKDLITKHLKDHAIISNLYCLDKLEKEIIILSMLGWTPEEIANDRGIPNNYVSAIRAQAVERLKNPKVREEKDSHSMQRREKLPANTSGYIGVHYIKQAKKYSVSLVYKKKRILRKTTFSTALEAAIYRNNFIIRRRLPHTLNKV